MHGIHACCWLVFQTSYIGITAMLAQTGCVSCPRQPPHVLCKANFSIRFCRDHSSSRGPASSATARLVRDQIVCWDYSVSSEQDTATVPVLVCKTGQTSESLTYWISRAEMLHANTNNNVVLFCKSSANTPMRSPASTSGRPFGSPPSHERMHTGGFLQALYPVTFIAQRTSQLEAVRGNKQERAKRPSEGASVGSSFAF